MPARFERLLSEDPSELFPWDEPIEVLTELQPVAMPISVYRYSLILNDPEGGLDGEQSKLAFLTNGWSFWAVAMRSTLDLRKRQKALGLKPEIAQLLVLQDDLRDPKETLKRVRKYLEIDRQHNPGFNEAQG